MMRIFRPAENLEARDWLFSLLKILWVRNSDTLPVFSTSSKNRKKHQ